ncbi:MAG TPA: cupin domain-containing protein [Roseiarcus sp.]|jgi:mannose-6-phosphate isomerase-like protein (cupin superfamily)|nr:cupin domain-containing protein [Roseiarcus sp.]
MRAFQTLALPAEPAVIAPDGTLGRILLALSSGSLAHFTLPAGAVSHPVQHRTVEEIWFFLQGHGEIWRANDAAQSIVAALPGVSITIPLGTAFQFRALGDEPLTFVAITMPPWPGDGEAFRVEGPWEAKLP